MSRHRPSLESLEGRTLPAVLQNLTPADAPAESVAPNDEVLLPPFVFGTPSGEVAVDLDEAAAEAEAQTFVSPPDLPDALLEQQALRRAAVLIFPASGGGGGDEEPHADEYAALLPAGMLLEETDDENPAEPAGPPPVDETDASSVIECAATEDGADGAGVEAL